MLPGYAVYFRGYIQKQCGYFYKVVVLFVLLSYLQRMSFSVPVSKSRYDTGLA